MGVLINLDMGKITGEQLAKYVVMGHKTHDINEQLNDLNKCLLSLKANFEPMYTSFMFQLEDRRKELTAELHKALDYKQMQQMRLEV